MKLKKGESIISEYYFSRDKKSFNKCVLTENRLVFITNNSEENYPLSKVTSVKVEKEESSFRSKVLGFSIVFLVILLIVTGYLIFENGQPDWTQISYLVPIYLILILFIRFGLKPDKITTQLVITQLGGTKKYVARQSKGLQDFIDKVNETMI